MVSNVESYSRSSSSSADSASDDEPDLTEFLRCHLCEESFNHVSTLRRHVKDHEASKCRGLNNEEYICPFCNRLFYFTRQYNAHMQKAHATDVDVSPTNSLATHSSSHGSKETSSKTERSFNCHTCGRRFTSRHGMVLHSKLHLPQSNRAEESKKVRKKRWSKQYSPRKKISLKVTNIESVSSGKPSSKEDHLSNVALSTDKEVNVSVTPEVRASSTGQEPMTAGHSLSPAISPLDEVNSSTPSVGIVQGPSSSTETVDLEIIENSTQGYGCDKCHRRFDTKQTLQLHLAGRLDRRQMHYCALCVFHSESQFAFALHVLDHYKKKFTCDICERSFYTRKTMELHAETHLPS